MTSASSDPFSSRGKGHKGEANPSQADQIDERQWFHALSQERWEQALHVLTVGLDSWQQSAATLPPFTAYFSSVLPAGPSLPQLDAAFGIVRDCAETIFGDLLPGFQTLAAGDDETVATLLFDLIQQADQLLIQLDALREPLNQLVVYFALEVAS